MGSHNRLLKSLDSIIDDFWELFGKPEYATFGYSYTGVESLRGVALLYNTVPTKQHPYRSIRMDFRQVSYRSDPSEPVENILDDMKKFADDVGIKYGMIVDTDESEKYPSYVLRFPDEENRVASDKVSS